MSLQKRADDIYEQIINCTTSHEAFNQQKTDLINQVKNITFYEVIDHKPLKYLGLLDTISKITSQYTRDSINSPLQQIRIIKKSLLEHEKINAYETEEVAKEFNGYFKNFLDQQLLDDILAKGHEGLPYGVGEKISDETIKQMSDYSIINLKNLNGFEKEFKKYLINLKNGCIDKKNHLLEEFNKLKEEDKLSNEIKLLNTNERDLIDKLLKQIKYSLNKINNEETVTKYDVIDIEEVFINYLINKFVPLIDVSKSDYLKLFNQNSELLIEDAVRNFENHSSKNSELEKIGQEALPDPECLIAKFKAYSSGLMVKGKEVCKGFSKGEKKLTDKLAELEGVNDNWIKDNSSNIGKYHKPSMYALSTNFLLSIPDYFQVLKEEQADIKKTSTPSPHRTARMIQDAFKPFLKKTISMKKDGVPAFLHESDNVYSTISSVDMDGFSESFNESWLRIRDSSTRVETENGFKWDIEGIKEKYHQVFRELSEMEGFNIDNNFFERQLPRLKIEIKDEEYSISDFERINDGLAMVKSFFEDKIGQVEEDLLFKLFDELETNKYKTINKELLKELNKYLNRIESLYGVPKDHHYLFLERELENGCLKEINDFTATKLYESTGVEFNKEKLKEVQKEKEIIQQVNREEYGKQLFSIKINNISLDKLIIDETGLGPRGNITTTERGEQLKELFKDLVIKNAKKEAINKEISNAKNNIYLRTRPGRPDPQLIELVKKRYGKEADEVIKYLEEKDKWDDFTANSIQLKLEMDFDGKDDIIKYLCSIEDKFELATADLLEQLNQRFNNKNSDLALNYLRFNYEFLNKEAIERIEEKMHDKIKTAVEEKEFQKMYEKIMDLMIGTENNDGLLWKAEAKKYENPEKHEGAITKSWNRKREHWKRVTKEDFAETFLTGKFRKDVINEVGARSEFIKLKDYLSNKFEKFNPEWAEKSLKGLISESLKEYFTNRIKDFKSNEVRWFVTDNSINLETVNELCSSLREAIFLKEGGPGRIRNVVRQYRLSFSSIKDEIQPTGGFQGNKEEILKFNNELFNYSLSRLINKYSASEGVKEDIVRYGLGIVHKDEKEQIPWIKLISDEEIKKIKINRDLTKSMINQLFKAGMKSEADLKSALKKLRQHYGLDAAIAEPDKEEVLDKLLPSIKTLTAIEGLNENISLKKDFLKRIRELSKGFWKIDLDGSCNGTAYAKLMKGVEYVYGLARKKMTQETYKLVNELESKKEIEVQADSIIKLLEKRCRNDLLLSEVAGEKIFKNHMKEVVGDALSERAKLLIDLESLNDYIKDASKQFIQKKMINRALGLTNGDFVDDHDFCNHYRVEYSQFKNLQDKADHYLNHLLNPDHKTNEIIEGLQHYFQNLERGFIRKKLKVAARQRINDLIKKKEQVQSENINELIPYYDKLREEIKELNVFGTAINEFNKSELAKEEASDEVRREFHNYGYRITNFINQARKIDNMVKESENFDEIISEKEKITQRVEKEFELKKLKEKELRFLIEKGTKLFTDKKLFETSKKITVEEYKEAKESFSDYEAHMLLDKHEFSYLKEKYPNHLLNPKEEGDKVRIKVPNADELSSRVINPLAGASEDFIYLSEDSEINLKKKASYSELEVSNLIDNLHKVFYLEENLGWLNKDAPEEINKRIKELKTFINELEKENFREELEELLKKAAENFNYKIKKKHIKDLYKEYDLYKRNWWPFSKNRVKTINKKGGTKTLNTFGLKKLINRELNQRNIIELLEGTGRRIPRQIVSELISKKELEDYLWNPRTINYEKSNEYQSVDELISDLGDSLNNAVSTDLYYFKEHIEQLRDKSMVKGALNDLTPNLRAEVENTLKQETAEMLRLFKIPFSEITGFQGTKREDSEVIEAKNFLRDVISRDFLAQIDNLYSEKGRVNSLIMSNFSKSYNQWFEILETLNNNKVLTGNQLRQINEFTADYSARINQLSELLDKAKISEQQKPMKELNLTKTRLKQQIQGLINQKQSSNNAITIINNNIEELDPANINRVSNEVAEQIEKINPYQSDKIMNIEANIQMLEQRIDDLTRKPINLPPPPKPKATQAAAQPTSDEELINNIAKETDYKLPQNIAQNLKQLRSLSKEELKNRLGLLEGLGREEDPIIQTKIATIKHLIK